jgi:hypothetical protein
MLFMTIFSLPEQGIQARLKGLCHGQLRSSMTTIGQLIRDSVFVNTHKNVYHKSLITEIYLLLMCDIIFTSSFPSSLPLSPSPLPLSPFSLPPFPLHIQFPPLSPSQLLYFYYFPLFTSPSRLHFHFSPLHFSFPPFTFSFLLFNSSSLPFSFLPSFLLSPLHFPFPPITSLSLFHFLIPPLHFVYRHILIPSFASTFPSSLLFLPLQILFSLHSYLCSCSSFSAFLMSFFSFHCSGYFFTRIHPLSFLYYISLLFSFDFPFLCFLMASSFTHIYALFPFSFYPVFLSFHFLFFSVPSDSSSSPLLLLFSLLL